MIPPGGDAPARPIRGHRAGRPTHRSTGFSFVNLRALHDANYSKGKVYPLTPRHLSEV